MASINFILWRPCACHEKKLSQLLFGVSLSSIARTWIYKMSWQVLMYCHWRFSPILFWAPIPVFRGGTVSRYCPGFCPATSYFNKLLTVGKKVKKAIRPPKIIVVLISLHSVWSNKFMSWSIGGGHFEAGKNYVLSLLYKSRETTACNNNQSSRQIYSCTL